MKLNEFFHGAAQLYFGVPINLHGFQLLAKRIARKLLAVGNKLRGLG
jgi:hypothetical protein